VIDRIASKEVQAFLRDHEHADEKALVLQNKTVLGLPASVIANQLKARKKAKDKLPSYFSTEGIVYPPSINLEQSSSEATAQVKTLIISNAINRHPETCADLTGGLGVDSFYFNSLCRKVHYIEPNLELLTIAKHNHERLGATAISYHSTTAEDFLKTSDCNIDFIYIDPSRRSSSSKKVYRLSNCVPDVTKLQESIFRLTSVLLIKTSPLLDIQQGLSELTGVTDVYVLSISNECKEVLFLCRANSKKLPEIHALNLTGKRQATFSFTRYEEQTTASQFSEPLTFIYEPNASILKAGAFALVGQRYGLYKLHPNTHIYTSTELIPDFPGRIFSVVAMIKANKKSIGPFFADRYGNVITRNYPVNADDLKKKMGLKDGGDQYLIACTTAQGRQTIVASRLQ
jgi:hypothetical protein